MQFIPVIAKQNFQQTSLHFQQIFLINNVENIFCGSCFFTQKILQTTYFQCKRAVILTWHYTEEYVGSSRRRTLYYNNLFKDSLAHDFTLVVWHEQGLRHTVSVLYNQ